MWPYVVVARLPYVKSLNWDVDCYYLTNKFTFVVPGFLVWWCGYLWRRFALNATFLFLPQAWNRTSRARGCRRPVSKMHKGLTAAARRTMDQSHKKMASRNTGTPAFLTDIPSAVCVLVCGEVRSWSETIELSGTFLGRVTICNGSVSYKTHTQKGTQCCNYLGAAV